MYIYISYVYIIILVHILVINHFKLYLINFIYFLSSKKEQNKYYTYLDLGYQVTLQSLSMIVSTKVFRICLDFVGCFLFDLKTVCSWTGEMVAWLRALVVLLEDENSSPRTHMPTYKHL